MRILTRPTWDETWMSIAHTVAKRSRCSRAGIGAVIGASVLKAKPP